MKKVVSNLLFVVSMALLTPVGTAFGADVSEPLCPPGNFNGLCGIKVGSTGGLVGSIIQVLLIIAILACLFFLVFGGIRYIMSGGDKGGIDQARGTIRAALIGLVISLFAFGILNLILIFFTGKGISGMNIPTLLQ
ncbi:MAG TPA: hypothetical protein VLF93_00305 [Candidatus Saccharimonadales bacterium]|nr:hypothetical protein [Candidatus Saccharimonadales bacterium]